MFSCSHRPVHDGARVGGEVGLVTRTESAGITVPAGTSVPSPRMQPLPRREPGMRIAPFPISHKSPMVAPTMVAR